MKVCTHCGYTWEEVQKKKALGCAHCYEIFSDEILLLLNSVPGNESWRSESTPQKIEETAKAPKKTSDDILNKEEKLHLLIRQEKFEEAAKVRDELSQLKSAREKNHGSH